MDCSQFLWIAGHRPLLEDAITFNHAPPAATSNKNEEKPSFRILAPQFVCPKDEGALVEKPDETVIMIQSSADSKLDMHWKVRWRQLDAPTQRFTLLVWRAVRELQAKLNAPQPVPNVYVIDNEQLLRGVDYNITVIATSNGIESDPKSFSIDNSQGDKKLENIEGRADMFSINLLGSQMAYVDVNYVLEAQITTCFPTEDYHFNWTVHKLNSGDEVDVGQEVGSRLVVPARSLIADQSYDATCRVIRTSTNAFITQTGLQFQVLRRGLEVYLSADHLVVSVGVPFAIEAGVLSHDFNVNDVIFEWTCILKEEVCDFLENANANEIIISSGLPEPGFYILKVKVSIKDEFRSAAMTVVATDVNLPLLQVTSVPRILNENSVITLAANATNIGPSCSLTWYFQPNVSFAENRENTSEHGEPITDTMTIYSLEENFLSELTDFSNETEWRQVTTEIVVKTGRARILAECGCSVALGCVNQGSVYADVFFQVNESPKPMNVIVSPETGVALETFHRITTLAAVDSDAPLKYMFYCSLGDNSSLLLGYYYEHLSIETFLPYVEGGTKVWVEVCDSRGACAAGSPTRVLLRAGEGRSVSVFIDAASGHLRRCELMMLQRVAVSAIVTYNNMNLSTILAEFTAALINILNSDEAVHCKMKNFEDYTEFIKLLTLVGFDPS